MPEARHFPDGPLRVLENPHDPWKLHRELGAAGLRVGLPEPVRRAWEWPEEWGTTVSEPLRLFAPHGARPSSSRRRPGRTPTRA